MGRVRVLYIQHATALSGSVVSLGQLIEDLDRERFEPIVATIRPAPEVRAYYERLGIPVIVASGVCAFSHTTGGWLRVWNPLHAARLIAILGGYRESVRATDRLLQQLRPNLVHLNSAALASSAEAVHRRGIPLVWHIRETVVRGHFGLRRRWLARLVAKLPDAAIFLSQHDMQQLGNHANWMVIPNSVDFREQTRPEDRDAARAALRIDPPAKVVLFLGGYSLIKGVLVLLQSIQEVARTIPDVRYLVVGAHERSSSFLPRAARLLYPMVGMHTPSQKVERALQPVRDHVTVLPWCSDVGPTMAAADALAFPSTEPHFARPVIEAFARGLPVVASDIGGVREFVEDHVTGRLVPPGDPRALAAALTEVLGDRALAQRLANNARTEGRKRFERTAYQREIVRVYEQVLAAHQGTGARQ